MQKPIKSNTIERSLENNDSCPLFFFWNIPAAGPYNNQYASPVNGGPNNTYKWVGAVTVTDLAGTPSQGNNNPLSLFVNHQVVKLGGVYFDPSYGNKPAGGLPGFDSEMAGFALRTTVAGQAVYRIWKNPGGAHISDRSYWTYP